MRHIRKISALAAIGAIAFVTGCSAGDDGDGGAVTLTLYEYQQTRADAIEPLLADFESEMAEQGTPVEVDLIVDPLTDDQAKTKLTQQLNAGQAPDVMDMGLSFVTPFAGAGYLLPLDDALGEWDAWDDFYPSVKEGIVQPDGVTYSIPHEASTQSLFYRRDVLEGLGIDTEQPQTWDDLVSRLEAITAQTGEPSIVIPGGTAWGGGSWNEGFLPILAGTGSQMYDAETGTWDLQDPGTGETFDLYAELFDKGLLPVTDLLNPNPWEPTKYVEFPEGTLPVAAQGTWGWKYDWGPEGAAPIPDVEDVVGVWDLPSLEAGADPYAVLSIGYQYAVAANSEHPDEAVALAQWLASGEALATQLVAVGAGSPRSGLDDVEPYASEPTLLEAEQQVQDAVLVQVGDGGDVIAQAIGTATESILTGSADGQQAFEAFQEDAADLLGPDRVSG